METISESEPPDSTFCAKLFRNSVGVYTFICWHCDQSAFTETDIVTHVEEHFAPQNELPLTFALAAEVKTEDSTEIIDVDSSTCDSSVSVDKDDVNVNANAHIDVDSSAFDIVSIDDVKKNVPMKNRTLPSIQSRYPKYECHYCRQFSCTNKALMVKHFRKCSYCKVDTSKKPYFKEAKLIVRKVFKDGPPYKCDSCNATFKYHTILRNHLIELHSRLEFTRTTVRCVICEKYFVTRRRLQCHMLQNHLDVKPFKCDKCIAIFASQSNLDAHSIVHVNEQTYTCDICSDEFKFKRNLLNHLNRHARNPDARQLYACGQCDRTFDRHISYRNHNMRNHLVTAPHQCTICDLSFSMSGRLTDHMKQKHEIQLYQCEYCDQQFTMMYRLRYHLKLHTDGRFTCLCKQVFKSAQSLRQHQVIHEAVKRYSCRYCDMRFSQAAGRIAHERMKHMLTPF